MDQERINYLLQRFTDDLLSNDEEIELLLLISDDRYDFPEHLIWQIERAQAPAPVDEKWDSMLATVLSADKFVSGEPERATRKLQAWRWLVAASIVLILGYSAWFFFSNSPSSHKYQFAANGNGPDIPPGGNKAVVTLPDGKKVILGAGVRGLISEAGAIQVSRTGDGQVRITNSKYKEPASNNPVIIETPRGGTYQVILPDGSKVWLNAASSLSFPGRFDDAERLVELSGEAYFEVAKNYQNNGERRPFVVRSGSLKVKVLGTHFNINAYPEDENIRTTLLEGSVAVSRKGESYLLKPGQVAIAKAEKAVSIQAADTEEAVAWKNEAFQFSGSDVHEVMRQLSRWYNVEVRYSDDMISEHYTGYISRNVPASKALAMLREIGDLNFIMTNGVITVTNKPRNKAIKN
ncbi:FecR family protein [Pararcticibacter amylolyticus]|uniref:Anti-sigma factor n=1 Tax=Pararcticibacter amylolyticus TaxID=2173175 RepID=A0A2U2PJD2_9SPHI|nr:FecR domain-containing protein [Pararcticibacter amylolyticus]PWG81516.1 anti-sigma factor [Pararcticibacter amylolyticus]